MLDFITDKVDCCGIKKSHIPLDVYFAEKVDLPKRERRPEFMQSAVMIQEYNIKYHDFQPFWKPISLLLDPEKIITNNNL
ncbi:MAG: hypothetical protein WCM76_11355 [Bacteroidota bacterium]